MQVNAINANIGFAGKLNVKNNNETAKPSFEGEKRNNNHNKVSNNALTNATKALALATLISLGSAGLGSCNKIDFNEEHIYPIEIPTDTIKMFYPYPIPGTNDTIKIKPGYDSPVAPVIEDFFDSLGIDPGDGRIPVRIAYTDEYRHPKVKMLFNEDKSSTKEMWYDVTTTDWDDEEGGYVEGKNENYYRVGYSTPDEDHQLVVKLQMIKDPSLDQDNELNWENIASAMYDTETGRRYEIDEDGVATYNGYFEKGDVPNSIFYVNEYGARRRYADVEVQSMTPPDTIIED